MADFSFHFTSSRTLFSILSMIRVGLFTKVTIFHHLMTVLLSYDLVGLNFNSFIAPLTSAKRK